VLAGLDWVGLGWDGLGWVGMGWDGFGWVGLARVETTGTLEPLRNLTGLIYVNLFRNAIGGTSARLFEHLRACSSGRGDQNVCLIA
jgi:hypothetical protein